MLEKDPSTSEIPDPKYFAGTYFTLRITIAAVTIVLPVGLLLWTGIDRDLTLLNSMSAYYYGPTRNIFVGALIATGVCLVCYKGFSKGEDWLLNIAGTLAAMVALFPTNPPGGKHTAIGVVHVVCALAFFAFVSISIWAYSRITLPALNDPSKQQAFRYIYRTLSIAVVVVPAVAGLFILASNSSALIFALEMAALYVFAIYWLVKTYELHQSKAEEKLFGGTHTNAMYESL